MTSTGAGTWARPLRLTARTGVPCPARACTMACPTPPVAPRTTCRFVCLSIFPPGFFRHISKFIHLRKDYSLFCRHLRRGYVSATTPALSVTRVPADRATLLRERLLCLLCA